MFSQFKPQKFCREFFHYLNFGAYALPVPTASIHDIIWCAELGRQQWWHVCLLVKVNNTPGSSTRFMGWFGTTSFKEPPPFLMVVDFQGHGNTPKRWPKSLHVACFRNLWPPSCLSPSWKTWLILSPVLVLDSVKPAQMLERKKNAVQDTPQRRDVVAAIWLVEMHELKLQTFGQKNV